MTILFKWLCITPVVVTANETKKNYLTKVMKASVFRYIPHSLVIFIDGSFAHGLSCGKSFVKTLHPTKTLLLSQICANSDKCQTNIRDMFIRLLITSLH